MVSPNEASERFPATDRDAWERLSTIFPVRISRSWARRVKKADDPLGLQVFPSQRELAVDPFDVPDPVGEEQRMPVPWVIQKHPDRLLLIVTRRCHVHCRYCFRRDLDGKSDPTREELTRAINFAKGSGVREVILSGGDPLHLRPAKLGRIIDELRPAVPLIRVHSRAPITFPAAVSDKLVQTLADRPPVWFVVHVNHVDELADDVVDGLTRLVNAGIPVLNQSVLLRGVNDNVDALAALVERLVELRIKPYYLHHPDAVPGSGGFRVSIEDGLELHAALRKRVSGIALPQYVIDPPDGTGKVAVAEHYARSVR